MTDLSSRQESWSRAVTAEDGATSPANPSGRSGRATGPNGNHCVILTHGCERNSPNPLPARRSSLGLYSDTRRGYPPGVSGYRKSMITKGFARYRIKSIRQDKTLRDHGQTPEAIYALNPKFPSLIPPLSSAGFETILNSLAVSAAESRRRPPKAAEGRRKGRGRIWHRRRPTAWGPTGEVSTRGAVAGLEDGRDDIDCATARRDRIVIRTQVSRATSSALCR
jgi:hypothetical protein